MKTANGHSISLPLFETDSKKNNWVKLKPYDQHCRFVIEHLRRSPGFQERAFENQLPMWKMAGSSSRTFWQLKEDVKRNAATGVSDPYAILNYHFKLSVPFSCLVMALCCPPMAMRFAKGGGFMGTLLSICLVFVYWNTMLLMRILGSVGPEGERPLLAPQVAAWTQKMSSSSSLGCSFCAAANRPHARILRHLIDAMSG